MRHLLNCRVRLPMGSVSASTGQFWSRGLGVGLNGRTCCYWTYLLIAKMSTERFCNPGFGKGGISDNNRALNQPRKLDQGEVSSKLNHFLVFFFSLF